MGYSDPPSVFARDGSLQPSSYADARSLDDVIAIEGRLRAVSEHDGRMQIAKVSAEYGPCENPP